MRTTEDTGAAVTKSSDAKKDYAKKVSKLMVLFQ